MMLEEDGELVDKDNLPDSLEECDGCGLISASLSNHVCEDNNSEPDHEKHVEYDGRGSDDMVAFYSKGNCYHELMADDTPLCRPNSDRESREPITREKAKKRNLHPCLSCLVEEVLILKELRVDIVGEMCGCTDYGRCHRCRKMRGGDVQAESREDFGNHCLCESCVEDLEEVLSLCEGVEDSRLRYPELTYTMVEADVAKGGTEWTCSNCSSVTEFECGEPHHPGTLQCSDCERVMTDPRTPDERQSYAEWEAEQAPEDDALSW